MKILIITSILNELGGRERLSIELAIALNRCGVRTDILSQYAKNAVGTDHDIEKKLKAEGVQSINYLDYEGKNGLFPFLFALFRLRKFVSDGGYTDIEVSGFTPSLMASLSTWLMNITVVQGLHQGFSKQYNGGSFYPLYLRAKLAYFFSTNTKFYAISENVKKSWVNYIGVRRDSITVIHNSINDVFYATDANVSNYHGIRNGIGATETDKLILFVGRVMKSKGVDILYHAVKNHLVANNMHLIYLGRLEDLENKYDVEMIDEIQNEIYISPWRERIHFLGERTDVSSIMYASDMLVHPVRCEGFGLVLAEALAVGIPIVASNVGGIPEVLNGTDSIMVEPNNQEELTNAILNLSNWKADKLKQAVIKGRVRAQSFNSSIRAMNILKLLES